MNIFDEKLTNEIQHSNQPNKVLFVEGLHHVDYVQLEILLRNFVGFR